MSTKIPPKWGDGGHRFTCHDHGQDFFNRLVRVQNGPRPLTRSPKLDQIATSRSQDMANRHYFSHTEPGGITVLNMLRSQGV